ncbi:MAG TPA: ABC transporter ATP-binding protein [Candidatus Nanopelagicales bacterium]
MIGLLRTHLAPYRRALAIVVALLVVQVLGSLYLPELNADIINNGVAKGDTGYIIRVGGWMLLVSLVVAAASIAGVYYASRTAMSVGRDIRSRLFTTVQTFSLREMNTLGAPSLITRNTNDVQQVQMFAQVALTIMITAPLMAVGAFFMAIRQDGPLSLLLLVIVPVMIVLIGSIMVRAVPLFRAMQVKIDRINLILRENLTGIRVIRAFVRTEHEEARFAGANDDLTATTLKVNRIFALLMPALMLVMNLSSVAVVWFGGHRVASGEMPVGNLMAFLAYLMQVLMSVMMATMVLVMWPRAAASSERINEVLAVEPAIHDPAVAEPAQAARRGTVEFRDVEFRYPGAADPVLAGISFVARPGQTTAIIGSTGSGKSTLINLVPRLYDVTGGAVLVDGVDVRDRARDALWASIGLVPQKAFLFSGTIADNLRFGASDASDDELWRALEIAQGADFVRALPEGLEAPIEQGGANVSGGQRQRLAIARALVRQPAVYIFDDSFSALDYATDARLRAALRGPTRESCVIVVAQRVATIRHADQILVLDEGQLVGVGTHEALMADCPTYAEIVLSQLSAEEAA